VENLQLLPYAENVSKSNKIEKIPDTIIQYLKENK
jgi:hypothetical protein